MPDNKTKKRPQDASRVNLSQPHEVSYWTKALGCTAAQLRAAVAAVGTSAAKIREHLAKSK